jgi:ABC-type transport system involved in multi-copper enzyme maturation permease subunit
MDVVVGVFVVLHGVLAVMFTWQAADGIRMPPPAWAAAVARVKQKQRRAADESAKVEGVQSKPDAPRWLTEDQLLDRPKRRRERPAVRSFRVPRLGDADPLLWKERFFSGRLPGFERGLLSGCLVSAAVLVLFPVGLWLFVALFELVVKGEDPTAILNPLAKSCAFAAAVVIAPVVGVRAATSVARERQRQTLDALLSLPVPRRDVLRAKLLAPLLWVRFWVFGVAAVVGIAGVAGSVHLLGLLVGVVLLAAFIPFADTLGLWLSVRCRSATRAVTWFLVVMIALCLAPVLLSTLTRSAFQLAGDAAGGEAAERFVDSFSVPYAAGQALFRWGEFRQAADYRQSAVVLTGVFVAAAYAVAAWGLWLDAVRRFADEGK